MRTIRLLAYSLSIMFLLMACEKLYLEQEQPLDAESEETTVEPSETDAYRTAKHPRACTSYNSHIIVLSDAFSPDSAELTLLSLQEWENIPSANNNDDPDEPLIIAESYLEGDIADWHIPTLDEVKSLRKLYSTTLQSYNSCPLVTQTAISDFDITILPELDTVSLYNLNILLQKQGSTPFLLAQGKSTVRYLCDDAKKSFSFISGTVVSKAGVKSTNYHLRLLKTIRIRI